MTLFPPGSCTKLGDSHSSPETSSPTLSEHPRSVMCLSQPPAALAERPGQICPGWWWWRPWAFPGLGTSRAPARPACPRDGAYFSDLHTWPICSPCSWSFVSCSGQLLHLLTLISLPLPTGAACPSRAGHPLVFPKCPKQFVPSPCLSQANSHTWTPSPSTCFTVKRVFFKKYTFVHI